LFSLVQRAPRKFMAMSASFARRERWVPSPVILKPESCWSSFCGIFVIEALSVILHVGSFKLRGKRDKIRMATLSPFRAAGLERIEVSCDLMRRGLLRCLRDHNEIKVIP